ncbi:hypothetical protein LBMAG42_10560 [Deltaproteobacteria bacterium]|nr:hypothetical protein LBMAG42_10560 [Deltaproteobacteria bacterium]
MYEHIAACHLGAVREFYGFNEAGDFRAQLSAVEGAHGAGGFDGALRNAGNNLDHADGARGGGGRGAAGGAGLEVEEEGEQEHGAP